MAGRGTRLGRRPRPRDAGAHRRRLPGVQAGDREGQSDPRHERRDMAGARPANRRRRHRDLARSLTGGARVHRDRRPAVRGQCVGGGRRRCADRPRRGRRSPDAGADRRRRRHVGGRRAVDRLDAGGTGKGPDCRGGAAAGCLVRRPAPTPARQRPDSGPHCRRHCPGTNRVAPVTGSKVMSGFIVNRHGRIVFPQNFFPRLDPGVFLPIVPPGDAGPLARILEAAYRAMPTAWDARLEDTVFGLLIEMVRSRRGGGVDVAARNPTVAQALADPESRTYRLSGYDADYPRYSEEDVLNFGHSVPELEALMRQVMILRNEFRWDPQAPEVVEVGRLRDDDVVILLYPRDEQIAAFIHRGQAPCRPRRSRPIPVAVEAPATPLAPVEVRRRFTVMPRLEALAVYKGELVCTNTDLIRNTAAWWSPMTVDDIERKTGIVERRYSELSLDDMALRAARAALAKAGRQPRDVGGVIVCTCTSARPMPSAATLLSARLGIFQTHASYDVVAACAGLPYGLAEAIRLLQEVKCPVLVVAVEKFSDKVGTVRASRMLFGDGAAALVVGPAGAAGRPDIEVFQTYASGPMSEVESIVWPNPEFAHGMTVYGPDVKAMVKRYLAQMLDELRILPHPDGRPGTMIDAIELIVPHQANQVMVAGLAQDAGFDPGRLYFNIARVGNTSSASIPIAIHDAVAAGIIDRPRLVFAPGFGAGAVAGYVCLRVDPAVVALEAAAGALALTTSSRQPSEGGVEPGVTRAYLERDEAFRTPVTGRAGKAASCGCPSASAHDTSTTVDMRTISAAAEWAATSTCSHGETTRRSLRSRSA